jgi:hypothetical protein
MARRRDMSAAREWVLKVVGDTSGVEKSLKTVDSKTSDWKQTAKGVAAGIGTAFAVDKVVEFGKGIVTAGSDTQQALGASQSVFKDFGGEIETFSKSTAKNLGLSQQQFLELATKSGALLKNAGLPLQEVTKGTEDLTTRAADMAAMFGGPVSDAMDAINSALKGETDPIEKYGVSLKESQINAKAMSMGLVDATGKVTDQGKAMARMQLIMDQTKDSQGTFGRESGTLAGQQAILGAQWQDLQSTLGQKLLPVLTQFGTILMGVMNFVMENQGWIIPVVTGIATLVLGIKAWTIAQAALNIVMDANPIGLIVIAIAAVIAAVVMLYLKVDWFRDFVDAAMHLIVDYFTFLWNWIVKIGGWIWTAIQAYIQPYIWLWQAIWTYINLMLDVWRFLIRTVGDILGVVWDVISVPFKVAIDFVIGYFNFLHDTFNKVRGWLYDAFRALDDIILAPFRFAFNQIKWLWNSTVGGFGFDVPSWVPGVGGKGFKIPMMAAGGIVTRPTIAMIGEGGAEAVVPLDRAGGLGSVTINVYAMTANAEVGRRVVEAIREYERTNGGVPILAR